MTSLAQLIEELGRRGATIALVGGKIRCSAPEGAIDDELVGSIRAHKEHLIDRLATKSDRPVPASTATKPDRPVAAENAENMPKIGDPFSAHLTDAQPNSCGIAAENAENIPNPAHAIPDGRTHAPAHMREDEPGFISAFSAFTSEHAENQRVNGAENPKSIFGMFSAFSAKPAPPGPPTHGQAARGPTCPGDPPAPASFAPAARDGSTKAIGPVDLAAARALIAHAAKLGVRLHVGPADAGDIGQAAPGGPPTHGQAGDARPADASADSLDADPADPPTALPGTRPSPPGVAALALHAAPPAGIPADLWAGLADGLALHAPDILAILPALDLCGVPRLAAADRRLAVAILPRGARLAPWCVPHAEILAAIAEFAGLGEADDDRGTLKASKGRAAHAIPPAASKSGDGKSAVRTVVKPANRTEKFAAVAPPD